MTAHYVAVTTFSDALKAWSGRTLLSNPCGAALRPATRLAASLRDTTQRLLFPAQRCAAPRYASLCSASHHSATSFIPSQLAQRHSAQWPVLTSLKGN